MGEFARSYNKVDTDSGSIGMSPNKARQQGNETMTWFNLWSNAKQDRKYPELSRGDEVRVMLNKKTMTKGYQPKWSISTYKITAIDGSDYLINDAKQKVYTKHELLKL